MAVVKPGSIVADIRGSVGDETYSRNRGGIYVKARTGPTQTPSALRDKCQEAYRIITRAWSGTLSEAQRFTWRCYADKYPVPDQFGHPSFLTGCNHFVRCNLYPYRVTSAIGYATAPLQPPPPLVAFTFTAEAVDDIIRIPLDFPTLMPIPHGVYLWAFVGKPVSPGVNYYSTPWRYNDSNYYLTDHWITDPWILTNPWPQTADQKVFLALVATLTDGATSGRWQTSAIIT